MHARYFSKSLETLLNRAYAKSKKNDEPVIDFDPVMNTQELPRPKNLAVNVESAAADKTTIAATWDEPDAHMTVRYDFIQEDGAWKIFDMRGDANGKDPWSLRKVAVEG